MWAIQSFVAPDQLAVDLREFLQSLPEGLVSRDSMPGQGLLFRRLEQELAHLARFETSGQVVEGTMPLSARTAAVGFAAGGEALDEGSAQQVGRQLEGTKQPIAALAQRESWFATQAEYLSHLLGQEYQTGGKMQEKEFASAMGKSSTA